jgi:hypothetical protein
VATTPTIQQQLDAVNAAIYAVAVAGQEYRLPDGRVVKHADLEQLRATRNELEARLGVATAGQVRPVFTTAQFRLGGGGAV